MEYNDRYKQTTQKSRRRLEEFDKLLLGESALTPVGPVNKDLIKIINVDYCCC